MSDVIRALRSRIGEIDRLLGEYRKLTEERQQLQGTLDFYERQAGVAQPFPGMDTAAEGSLAHLTLVHNRFSPKPDSKTSRIVAQVRTILEHTPGNAAPFPSVLRQLPAELIGSAENAKEGVRTAIKRAGRRVGVSYEQGGIVRWKSPQAASA